ncbi:MAG: hypothetical protein M3019_00780 [Candidatus Dormibacteraeota bacterium]|nr:hypothetical protein [Candidatus Dormibacteraeota bacterium]
MISKSVSARPAHVVRSAALVCVAAAVGCALIGLIVGRPSLGLGLAVGLAVGAGNGYAADRLLLVGVPFVATSMLRIIVLTLVALGAGLAFGFGPAIPVVAGLACAQLILAGSAVVESVRR